MTTHSNHLSNFYYSTILHVIKKILLTREEKQNSGLSRKKNLGYFTNLFQKLKVEGTEAFKEMLKISYSNCKWILAQIKELTTPQIAGGHKVVGVPERLVKKLRFLAHGESFKSLNFQFRVSDKTIIYIPDIFWMVQVP